MNMKPNRLPQKSSITRRNLLRWAGASAVAGASGSAALAKPNSGGDQGENDGEKSNILLVVRRGFRSDPGHDDWNQITDQAIHVLEEAGYPNLEYFKGNKGYRVLDLFYGLETENFFAAHAYEKVEEIWGNGFDAIIAATASAQAIGIEQFQATLPAPVPHIQAWAIASAVNNDFNNYFMRTTNTGVLLGEAAAQEAQTLPPGGYEKIAFIARENDAFGQDVLEGWESVLGPVDQVILMNPDGTVFDPPLSTLDAGVWLVGSALATTNSVSVVDALASHLNSANIYLTLTGIVINEDYSAYQAWLDTNSLGLITWFDEASDGFTHWQAWSGLKLPVSGSIALQMADAAKLMVSGLERGYRGEHLYSAIHEISAAPGTLFYVDDPVDRVKSDLDYAGASGPIDLQDGEITSAVFKIWIGPRTGTIVRI